MQIVEEQGVTLPTNPEDLKRIKEAIQEISNSMTRVDAERDNIKAILGDVKDKYNVAPKYLRKVARAYHKQSFGQEEQDFETIETIYRQVLGD